MSLSINKQSLTVIGKGYDNDVATDSGEGEEEATLEGIELILDQTEFVFGDTLYGMSVMANWSNGDQSDVTEDSTFSPINNGDELSCDGDITITAEYEGFSDTGMITVTQQQELITEGEIPQEILTTILSSGSPVALTGNGNAVFCTEQTKDKTIKVSLVNVDTGKTISSKEFTVWPSFNNVDGITIMTLNNKVCRAYDRNGKYLCQFPYKHSYYSMSANVSETALYVWIKDSPDEMGSVVIDDHTYRTCRNRNSYRISLRDGSTRPTSITEERLYNVTSSAGVGYAKFGTDFIVGAQFDYDGTYYIPNTYARGYLCVGNTAFSKISDGTRAQSSGLFHQESDRFTPIGASATGFLCSVGYMGGGTFAPSRDESHVPYKPLTAFSYSGTIQTTGILGTVCRPEGGSGICSGVSISGYMNKYHNKFVGRFRDNKSGSVEQIIVLNANKGWSPSYQKSISSVLGSGTILSSSGRMVNFSNGKQVTFDFQPLKKEAAILAGTRHAEVHAKQETRDAREEELKKEGATIIETTEKDGKYWLVYVK